MALPILDTRTVAFWTIAAILGLTIFAPGLYDPVIGVIDAPPMSVADAVYSGTISGLLAGVVIGIGQYLAVAGRLAGGRAWIGVTILGAAIGGAVVGPLYEDLHWELRVIPPHGAPGMWLWVLGMAVWGAGIGVGQFLVLRPCSPRAGWWVVIASGTWALATVVAFWLHEVQAISLGQTPMNDYLWNDYLWIVIPTGVVVGILQPAALRRLLPLH
ncbi:MAG: hypothetical protein M3Z04_09765 [Chloroflexota bacterium]|nr:hypothetical protein [Chloroflexota bacterium]